MSYRVLEQQSKFVGVDPTYTVQEKAYWWKPWKTRGRFLNRIEAKAFVWELKLGRLRGKKAKTCPSTEGP